MKRSAIVLGVVISIVLTSSLWNCKKKSKYEHEITIIDQFCKLTDTLTLEVDKSSKRVSVGKVIVEYIREYKRLKPDFDKIVKKFPDLRITGGEKNAPEELKPYFKKVAGTLSRLRLVLDGKKARFASDEDLLKIIFELKEVMYYY